MSTGIIILDNTTIYYTGRYSCFASEPPLRQTSSRTCIARLDPHHSRRHIHKPVSYILRTTNRWIQLNILIPPSSTRTCAFNRILRARLTRHCYYSIDTSVRYASYNVIDTRAPFILNTPKFLNWPEVPRTFYLDCEVFSYVDIVPETVLVILHRVDKGIIKKYSLHTSDDLKVIKDHSRPGIYRIICYFREIFDPGEKLKIYIDLHTIHGIVIQ